MLLNMAKIKTSNIVYTYLYTTAANKVAHLRTKFTAHKNEWIGVLGSRLKVVVCFYL